MPISIRFALALPVLAFFGIPIFAHPQEQVAEYSWTGGITPGRLVEVSGLYSGVVVEPVLTPTLHLYARKHGLHDDVAALQVQVDNKGDRLRICTTRPGHNGECDPVPGYETVLDRDTQADMKIQLPLGSPLIVRNTYGDVDLRGITGEVHVFTQQGKCRLETSRGGEVETLNGDVTLALGRMLPQQNLHVKSVNGKILLNVPRDFDAEVTVHTDNGRVLAQGATAPNGGVPRSGHWLFGEPHAHIVLETENGNIELHRM